MSFPILYEANTTDFFNLGLGILTDTIRCQVIESRNGEFYLELEYPVDSYMYSFLSVNRMIVCHAGHELHDQRFVIKRISDQSAGTAVIYAEHISYVMNDLALLPEVSITSATAQTALTIWKNAIIDEHSFQVASDITTTASTKWTIKEVQTAKQALGGVAGSILDYWGGEYKFDNERISLLKKRGKNAGCILAYGKNIIDLDQENNIMATYTSIYPYAVYGTGDEEKLFTLAEYFVDSDQVNKFPNRKIVPVDFSREFSDDNKPSQQKLRELAKKYISQNEIGIPKVSMKVSFLDLAKTEDYADVAPLEELNLCDTVQIFYERLGINTTAKVVRTAWNALLDQYDEIEIGEPRANLSSTIKDIQNNIKETDKTVNEVQTAANGKNTIFRGPDEPKANLIGDMWYKPVGDEIEFYIWNGTVWEFIMSTKGITEAQEAAEEAKKQADEAIAEVEKSKVEAEKALEEAAKSKEQADKALEEATAAHNEAIETSSHLTDVTAIANEAKTTAGQAIGSANQAMIDAKNALDSYNNLDIGTRNIVRNSLYQMISKPGQYNFLTATWAETDTFYYQPERDVEYTVTFKGSVADTSSTLRVFLQNPPEYSYTKYASISSTTPEIVSFTFKVPKATVSTKGFVIGAYDMDKAGGCRLEWIVVTRSNQAATDWMPAPEDIQTAITNINGELSQKVSQTSFNQLEGTVAVQGTQVTQNKNDIALRATKTEVNTLSGKVSAAEGKLSVQADKIDGLVTKTDGQTTEIANLKITADGLHSTVSKVQTEINSLEVGHTNRAFGTAFEDMSVFTIASGTVIDKGYKGIRNSYRGVKDTTSAYKGLLNQKLFSEQLNIDNRLENHQWYTLSFDAKGTEGALLYTFVYPSRVFTTLMYVNGVAQPGKSDGAAAHTMTEAYKKYTVVFQTNNFRTPVVETNLLFRMMTTNAEYEVASIKLEKGNKATDWSPAPEDLVSEVSFSSLQQTVDAVQSTVVNKAEQSQVTQMAGQITSTVDKVASLLDRKNLIQKWEVGALVWATGAVAVGSDRKRTDFIEVESSTAYANSLDGQKFSLNVFEYDENKKYISSSSEAIATRQTFITKATTKYIKLVRQGSTNLNEKLQMEKGNTISAYAPYISDVSQSQISQLSDQIVSVVSKTETVAENLETVKTDTKSQITQLSNQISSVVTDTTTIKGDVKSNKTQITQLSNQITSTVTSVEKVQSDFGTLKKSTESQITQLSGLVNSTVSSVETVTNDFGTFKKTTESQITQLSNNINLKVSQAQVDASITANNQVKDTRNDNQLPSWYFSNYPKQIAKELKLCKIVGLPDTAGTYSYVETEVRWGTISGGNITQTATTNDGTYQRKSNGTTAWFLWAKITDSSNLMSQINVSSGNILIQSNKLYLDSSSVVFSGKAFIPSAAITSLAADKITAGTLNAANVNIINMNAANISSGYINSARIQAGSITADKLAVNAILVGLNSASNVIKISATDLKAYNSGKVNMSINGVGFYKYDPNSGTPMFSLTHWGGSKLDGVLGIRKNYSFTIARKTEVGESTQTFAAMLTFMPDDNYIQLQSKLKMSADIDVNGKGIIGTKWINGKTYFQDEAFFQQKAGISGSFEIYNGSAVLCYRDINMNGYSVRNNSGHSLKEAFKTVDPEEALGLFLETDVLEYVYKDSQQHSVGYVINDDGESPYYTAEELIRDGQFRDDSLIIGYLMSAVKQLNKKIELLSTNK